MAGYRTVTTPQAQRQLFRLPARVVERFREAIRPLEDDPFTPRPGVDIRPLEGCPVLYRLRVGAYRGIYQIEGDEVVFTKFGHRSRVYR